MHLKVKGGGVAGKFELQFLIIISKIPSLALVSSSGRHHIKHDDPNRERLVIHGERLLHCAMIIFRDVRPLKQTKPFDFNGGLQTLLHLSQIGNKQPTGLTCRYHKSQASYLAFSYCSILYRTILAPEIGLKMVPNVVGVSVILPYPTSWYYLRRLLFQFSEKLSMTRLYKD